MLDVKRIPVGAWAAAIVLVFCSCLLVSTAYADDASSGSLQTAQPGTAAADDAAQTREAAARVVADGLYNIRSVGQKKYSIAVKGASAKKNAAVVPQKRSTSEWGQKWIVAQDPQTGYYTIRNLNSRLMLSVAGKVKSGASLKQVKQASSKKQLWELAAAGKAVTFKSAANPKLAIALVKKKSAFKLALRPVKSAEAQQFRLGAVDAIEDGHSYFVRNAASGKGLTVKGGSKKSGAKLVMAKKKAVKAQKFRLYKAGAGYRVQNVNSTLYVGAAKSALKQTAKATGKARKWDIALDLQTGTFSFASWSTGKRLQAKGAKASLKSASASAAQQFALSPTYGFKLFLDPGHGANSSGYGVYDPGASGSGRNEADLTKDLARRIQKHLAGTDVLVCNGADYRVPYWQRNGKAKSLGCDAVLSVHFDAGGGSSTSTMVGTRGPVGRSQAFNRIIHRKLVSSIGLRDGGTSHRSDITVVNGLVPAVLMEVCFIDNYSSLSKYLGRRDGVAASLAEGVLEASRTASLQ